MAAFLADATDGCRSQHAIARERGLRLHKLAGILAAQLSPDWRGHAGELAVLVERYAGVRSIIAAGDAHSLQRYLKVMLHRALTHPDAVVPWHSPVRAAYEREILAVERAATAAHTAALRDELDQRDAAATTERAGDQAGRHAARAIAAAVAGRDWTPRVSGPMTARAEQTAAVDDWPTPVRPGSGRPNKT